MLSACFPTAGFPLMEEEPMSPPGQPVAAAPTLKEHFLSTAEREHATTLAVLRAYPTDRLDYRPVPGGRTARDLGWIFAVECMMGMMVFKDEFTKMEPGPPPEPPANWDELIETTGILQAQFGSLVRDTPDKELLDSVHFLTGPRTVGKVSRLAWLWFLLGDEIHHRGQLSVYLRLVGARVPSIYGPTLEEQWL
jgi:hypothetical protein